MKKKYTPETLYITSAAQRWFSLSYTRVRHKRTKSKVYSYGLYWRIGILE